MSLITSNGGGKGENSHTSIQIFNKIFLLSQWDVKKEVSFEEIPHTKHQCKACGKIGHHSNGNCSLQKLETITALVESTEEEIDEDYNKGEIVEEPVTIISKKGIITSS
jgi:hypothetical protein